MATTIAAAFSEFKSNLEISGLQSETVSTRQKNVREAVEDGLSVLSSFLTGSYIRSTMIKPLTEADIDIFVVLDPQYYHQNKPASLLDKVRGVLLKKYPRTPKISRNGQAVTVTFSDFVVDVVPAFNRIGGGYIIPNSVKGEWIETDPKVHESYISDRNLNHNGVFVPMVKMLKAWNRKQGKSIKSFYLELLAAKIFSGITISDYSSGARYFFDKGREGVKYTIPDPAGLGGQVQGLYTGTVEDAVDLFQVSYDLAVEAESFARQGDIRSAIDRWKILFGDYFPSYG